MYKVRDTYYRWLAKVADVEVVHQATGFGIYDQRIILAPPDRGPVPVLSRARRGNGLQGVKIPYRQEVRRAGKSKISTYELFDVAFQGIVNHSKIPLRMATLTGVATAPS